MQRYRDDERFLACPRAFLVTGTQEKDKLNRELLDKNQSGHWFLREGRVEQGDAIFLLLPDLHSMNGYPRELFGGILSEPPDRKSIVGKALFKVEHFYRLGLIVEGIKEFLGGHLPPQGDTVMSIWDDMQDRKNLNPAPGMDDGNEDDDNSYPEGAEKFKQHRSIERNRKVVELAKLRRFKRTGKLECEVCSFDFEKIYGDRGRGFIEAHHRIPISSFDALAQVRIKDFALVCSNCHRMLNRMSPLMTVEDLKKRLSDLANGSDSA